MMLILITLLFSAIIFNDNPILSGMTILLMTLVAYKKNIGYETIGTLGAVMIMLAFAFDNNGFAWSGLWLAASMIALMVKK